MTITISLIYIIRYSVISKQGINTSDLCFVSEHPNVRLLITHGGMSSITEAIYAGVPIIGIPLFSDQDANIHSLQNKQVGILLELQTLSKDNVLKAIHTVLDDTKWVNLSCSESSNPMLSKTSKTYYNKNNNARIWVLCRNLHYRELFMLDSGLTIFEYLIV